MASMRQRDPRVIGVLGLVVAAVVLTASFNINALRALFGEETYTAEMVDAGGLRSGDDVRVHGIAVGSVKSIELDGAKVTVTFGVGDVQLGDRTTLQVKSDNALGSKFLSVSPAGSGRTGVIDVSRTDPGYAISEVLGDVASTAEGIDVDQLSRAFESVAETMEVSPDEFADVLRGVTDLSRTVASRDEQIGELLAEAGDLSGTLAERSEHVVSLMKSGGRLLAEVEARRETVGRVFLALSKATAQLEGLVEDNPEIQRDLKALKELADLLAKNRAELDYTIQTVPKYIRSLGESISSGPFYMANVTNITSPQTLLSVENVIQDILGQNAAGEK